VRGRDGTEWDGMGGEGESEWGSPTHYFRLKSCTAANTQNLILFINAEMYNDYKEYKQKTTYACYTVIQDLQRN